jgi:formylglycine-generating enzyme required for sulfatase activity
MAKVLQAAGFFTVGGTLEREAASYASRPADDQLLNLTLAGEYCNVLAARQTGKSSLMVRTADRLKRQGVRPVIIDLTSIGSLVSSSEWYFGLISYLTSRLNLDIDAKSWWNAEEEKSAVQRFSDFLYEVILKEISEPIVIFVDEIDSTLKLGFTDDFFASIRAAYNARSQNADLKRLTFVLLGVARPADLIKDRTRTPYNIGTAIDITDFRIEELGDFEAVLERAYPRQGRQILEWVLNWTGGQPYLTQKLCSEVVKQANGPTSEDQLALLVERLFLGDMARTETNLRSIRDHIKHNPYIGKMLTLYRRILANQKVVAEEQSIEQNELKLTGLVKTTPQGDLQVRNRIYAHVFDENWVRENMPVSTTQRLAVITSIIAALAIGVAGYFYYQQQNQTAEIQARTYIDNFSNSNSPEVKITSLAGLFGLGGDYATQAQDLFDALSPEEQLTLFGLTTPANVGGQLVIVVEEIYQKIENTSEGNALLKAMADALAQTNTPGATSLTLEINTWLDARQAASQQEYVLAISLYTRAFEYSQDRNAENATILVERASMHTILKQYAEALTNFDSAARINDEVVSPEVQNTILENQQLVDYLRENASNYPNLSRLIAIPEVVSTATPTATATVVAALSTEISDIKGVSMRLVPQGEFVMGSDDAGQDERPAHRVYVDSFYMDKFEVTNELYAVCVNAGGCESPKQNNFQGPTSLIFDFEGKGRILGYEITNYYDSSQYANFPVVYVSWSMAKTYCEWRDARLPTEAEWEKASRGMESRIYAWGDGFDCHFGNFFDFRDYFRGAITGPLCDKFIGTSPVGEFPGGISSYGIYDLSGNVWEWVSSLYKAYPYDYKNAEGSQEAALRVFRGGSYLSSSVNSRVLRRQSALEDFTSSDLGFRCASSINGSVPTDYVGSFATQADAAPIQTPTVAATEQLAILIITNNFGVTLDICVDGAVLATDIERGQSIQTSVKFGVHEVSTKRGNQSSCLGGVKLIDVTTSPFSLRLGKE